MNTKEHANQSNLLKYSFLWSEARLVIAAIALFLGGIPPALAFNPIPGLTGMISSLLTLSWIISGIAAGYLLYQWNNSKRILFGGKKPMDVYAFWVMIISGLNLGLAGIFSTNIGMSISSNRFILFIVGLLYLISAYSLYQRWKEKTGNLF